MTDAKINPNTGLPHSVSLSSVLDQIRLAPHEIAALFASWGAPHQGTPQDGLAMKMRDAAAAATDPRMYGMEPPKEPQVGTNAPQPVVPVISFPERAGLTSAQRAGRQEAEMSDSDKADAATIGL